MLFALQVVAILFIAVAMGLALAHALELPGKLRLDEHTYVAVQTIYYPGFTIGGICEPLAIVATLILLLASQRDCAKFWEILVAFLAAIAMQGVFWIVTQPVNRFWLKNEQLNAAGARFFSMDRTTQAAEKQSDSQDWKQLRNRWEYSHVARAVLAGVALIAMVIASAS